MVWLLVVAVGGWLWMVQRLLVRANENLERMLHVLEEEEE